jgi:hypothetical protein
MICEAQVFAGIVGEAVKEDRRRFMIKGGEEESPTETVVIGLEALGGVIGNKVK